MTDIMTHASPADWQLFRLGQLFRERKEKGSDKDFSPLSVTMGGIVPQLETAAKTDDGDNRKIVRIGDYVINSRSDRKGSGGISEYEGSVSLISIVLQPRNIDAKFAHHLMRSTAFQEEFYRWGHGIVADLWTTRYADMKNIRLRVPDLPTQRTIADFLDRETARIDSLIEKKQRLVELLGEKRCAVITASVTDQYSVFSEPPDGGDSRSAEGGGGMITVDQKRHEVRQRLVEENEFPNIPENWSIERLRFLFSESKERNGKVPVGEMLSVSEYHGVIPREYEHEEQKRTEEELENYRVVRPGQLAVNSMWLNHLGLGVSDHIGHVSPAYNVYDLSYRLDRRFVHHLMRSNYYLKIYLRYLYGIRPNSFQIKSNDWASIPIIVPDLPTQRAIADFLDRETARIDSLIEKTKKSINRLKEYRSALITSAVTGQIDVSAHTRSGTTDRQLDAIQSEMQA